MDRRMLTEPQRQRVLTEFRRRIQGSRRPMRVWGLEWAINGSTLSRVLRSSTTTMTMALARRFALAWDIAHVEDLIGPPFPDSPYLTMTPETFLTTVEGLGIQLMLEGSDIIYSSPNGAITPEISAAMNHHCVAILGLLRTRAESVVSAGPPPESAELPLLKQLDVRLQRIERHILEMSHQMQVVWDVCMQLTPKEGAKP